uniref:Solute carrier family 13 member 1 n=1 Tax=Anas platyrhynchos TaxID=8839 RepID=A0A8B9ZJL4_ANAPL
EALPLAVSALLPAFMFPLFGIMESKEVASAYFKDFHLLLMGVICLATSIEKWNFHKRVALRMVMLVGVNPAWLTLGFMVSCSFLSMWLSNTSAAAMVMPIVEAVAQQITTADAEADMLEMSYSNGSTNLALELDGRCMVQFLFAHPHSAAHQTPHNMKVRNFCKMLLLTGRGGHFFSSAYTVNPSSNIADLPSSFKSMFKCGKKKTAREEASAKVIQEEYKKLGPMSYPEIVTLILFILMTLLWFTREPGFIPGWSSLFPKYKGYATDSTTALVIGLLFFIIPAKTLSRTSNGESTAYGYTPLITWKEFQSCMPWEIAILVGGGFALADGCEVSKLSAWVASKLTPLGSLPLWLIILISCLIVTSVTEVASNPATITIFLPILSPLAEAIHVNPLFILIPATLCTSFAFLLPVANPANAIVFSYGHLTVMDMVKAGLGINIIGVAVVMLGIMTWIVPIFDLYTYPSWAPIISSNSTGL